MRPRKGHSPAIMGKGAAHRDRTKYYRKAGHTDPLVEEDGTMAITVKNAALRMEWVPDSPLADFGTLTVWPGEEPYRQWVERGVVRRRGVARWLNRATWLHSHERVKYAHPCACPACGEIAMRVVGTNIDNAGRLFQESECEACGWEES